LFSVLIPGHLGLSALGLLQSSSRGILSGSGSWRSYSLQSACCWDES
ncbi:unnamed protein product, partial [Choristocarpus tenellus]